MKRCTKCLKRQPFSSFAQERNRPDGKQLWCRSCKADHRRQHDYGVSLEEYNALIAHGCAICGSHTRIHLDHDHANGQLRSALCHLCNSGLGSFHDSSERLRAAADYLEDWRGRHG